MNFKFKHCVIGGTFDRLHQGHISLFKQAFKSSEKVSICIVNEVFDQKKVLSKAIQPYETRKKEVEDYLKRENLFNRAQLLPLSDIFGISIIDKTLDAILVTRETYKNAVLINKKRKEKHLPLLSIVRMPFIKDRNQKIIRSSRIRLGEIDRGGTVYKSFFEKQLLLPNSLRKLLKKPTDQIILGEEKDITLAAQKVSKLIKQKNPPLVISVGDIVTSSMHKIGAIPSIEIIDFMTQRKKLITGEHSTKRIVNKAGSISKAILTPLRHSIVQFIFKSLKKRIVIRGEEDLLTLPAILLAPLGSFVLYGQVGYGIIVVEVTEQKKKEIREIIDKFSKER